MTAAMPETERQRGPDHARDAGPRIFGKGHVAERRDLGKVDRAEDDDQRAGEEARGRDPEQSEDARREIDRRPAPHRAQHAEGNAKPDRDRHGHQPELQGDRHPREDPLDDGTAVNERVAEIAVQEDAPQPPDVLLQKRTIEAELREDARARLGVVGGGDAHHLGDDVARNDADQQESQQRHAEHDGDQQQQTPHEVPTHAEAPVQRRPGS